MKGKITREELDQSLIDNISSQLNTLAYNINSFPRLLSETDDSARIQRAINFISENGGGELLLNTSEQYDIKNYLYIKRNVILKGNDISNILDTMPQLNIYVGKNDINGKSALTMDIGSSIKNLRFFYPEQVKGNESIPIEYSYTIGCDTSINSDDIRLKNLMLLNPYQGISLEGAGRFYLSNIYGDPIYKGLHVDQVYDVSRMEHIHFWDFNYNYAPGLREWKQANRIGYELLHIDQLSAIDCFIVGSRIGFFIGEEFWGDLTNCICDFAEKPLYIHECDMLRVNGGSFITNSYKNPIITTSNDIKGRALFTNISMFGGASVDVLISSNTGKISFNNCDFKKGELVTEHLIPTNGYRFSPLVVEGDCEVILSGCPGINKSMIIGKNNIIIDGVRRVKNGNSVRNDNFNMSVWENGIPKNWAKKGQGTIKKINNGVEIDVTPMNVFTSTILEYDLNTDIKFSGKLYNIEFDYELVDENTSEIELSFSINNDGYDKPCGNYTGIKTPLNCNKKIHVCLPFYLGAYLNQPKFMIFVRTLHDLTTGKFRVSNLSMHEIERKSLSKNEFDNIVKDIFMDSYDNGNITLEFNKNITVKAYRPEDVSNNINGDRIINIEPSVGNPKSWIYIDNQWISEGNIISEI